MNIEVIKRLDSLKDLMGFKNDNIVRVDFSKWACDFITVVYRDKRLTTAEGVWFVDNVVTAELLEEIRNYLGLSPVQKFSSKYFKRVKS